MKYTTLCSLCLTFLTACGSSESSYEGPQRASVSGTITFEGQPLEAGAIKFVPKDNELRPVSGLIGQGQYSIEEGKGPNLGEYRVEIFATAVSTGDEEEETDMDDEEYVEMEDEESSTNPQTENMIPRKYNYDSELTITIDGPSVSKDFDL